MGRRSRQRRVGSRGIAYIGAAGLAVVALLGALILFLRRRARDTAYDPVEDSVQETPETPPGRIDEVHVRISRTEPQEAPEYPADQEQNTAENQREGVAKDLAQERRRTVSEFARRLEERPTGQEESASIVGDATPASEESSQDSVPEAAKEETEHSGETEGESGQVTVEGVLAKMGEAYQEVGGTRFILSSEDKGNFDLLGKEDELDDVYQQQVSARVVGKVVEDDSQTKKLEVYEVEPA